MVLITTGSQGESAGSTFRMASNAIVSADQPGDTIFSSAIRNEKAVSRVINELSMKGGCYFQDTHVSGGIRKRSS